MRYTVKYSKAAIRDLDNIWEEVYRASRDHDITEKYINDLLDKAETKAEFPKTGAPLYYEDTFTGYYHISFKAYMIFYRVDDQCVFIDRILHGKSNYLRILRIHREDDKE